MAENNGEQVQTLEKGDVFFFYRPRVEEEAPSGQEDLQRLYLVLVPEQEDRVRLAIIGQKELPDPSKKGKARYWGFIDMVRKSPGTIMEELGEETYQTKTRGERHLPAARPAGEGRYRILTHEDHTHLVYSLELPRKPSDVQEDLQIEDEASYIISIKNPDKGSPQNVGLSEERKADLPKKLMEVFGDRRFANADPPEFLDHEGVEFLLVAASDDLSEELGVKLETEKEDRQSADIFSELKMDREQRPLKPLLQGEWA
jgi:hypothetical protein